MSKLTCFLVCFVIVAIDAICAIFSYQVRETQNQVEHLSSIDECERRSHEATLRVAFAVIFLIVVQSAVNLVAVFSCFSRGESPEPLGCRNSSAVCLIFTWLITCVAVTMMLLGDKSNEKSVCSFTYRPHVMIGGILCIFHALFALPTYLTSAAFHH